MGGSPLGNLIVGVTVNTLGLSRGLATALVLTTNAFAAITHAALNSGNLVGQGLGLIGVAALGAAGVVLGLVAAMTNLARAGAGLIQSQHDVEQRFGSFTGEIEAAADRQAKAFGLARGEYLSFAAQVGWSLQKLGIGEEAAAQSTMEFLDAIQQLAQSRGIGFAEAFAQATARGALFTDQQVRGWALVHGMIRNVNEQLTAGNEALVRNAMAVEVIKGSTEASAEAANTWGGQLNAVMGTFRQLGELVGKDIEPIFVGFFRAMQGYLRMVIDMWTTWMNIIKGIIEIIRPLLKAIGIELPMARGPAEVVQDRKAIDIRNAAAAKGARKEQAIGEAMGGGGGGSRSGVAGGGLAEFARHLQQAAMNQGLAGQRERQLKAAEEQVILLRQIRDKLGLGKQGIQGGPGLGAAGGIAGILAGLA